MNTSGHVWEPHAPTDGLANAELAYGTLLNGIWELNNASGTRTSGHLWKASQQNNLSKANKLKRSLLGASAN